MNVSRLITIIVLSTCYFSCNKADSNPVITPEMAARTFDSMATVVGYETFLIPQGGHYSTPDPVQPTLKNEFLFKVLFDNSCIYQTVDPINQADINKLYGFSDCNSQHLVNSARIGWRWYNNELQLLAFVHKNGVIQPETLICSAAIGSILNCRITCLPDRYQFEVNGIIKEISRACSERQISYRLRPYFGGDETAPHNISVLIDEL